jgi:hypothetical protein
MFLTRRYSPALWIALGLLVITAQPSVAQERLCDTAFEDCRQPLWDLIDTETVGIDIAFWYLTDESYVTKLINRYNAGVRVRVMVDPRANEGKPVNGQRLAELQAAGIPMRQKVGGGILHWKMMFFASKNKVEFSAANYDPFSFVPNNPYVDYTDEAIYFSDDPSVVNSFKTKFDDIWTDTAGHSNYANITTPLTRAYPTFPLDPDLVFPPGVGASYDEFANRAVASYNQETLKIDVIMFRLTDQRHTNALINAVNRGVVVRFLAEPAEYRSPNKRWDSWNIDRLYMAGVQIKSRKHAGETHEKLAVLYAQGLTIFGSSNWTSSSSNSQEEHNYFTHKPSFFQWFSNHFERKWNAPTEYEPFVPLPPDPPTNLSPSNGATGQTTTMTLKWEGGYYAHKYDIYFGPNPNPPLKASDITTGSIEDGITETYSLSSLAAGTTYYWRIVGKTMANKTANGPTWSFTTSGTPPSNPTVTAISPNSGSTTGGASVTITGTGFLAGASVSIGGSPATNVNVSSSTSITAITPAHATGTVNVVVTNSDGRSGTLTNGYTYTSSNPAPTVTAISPNSGTTTGATAVTISGTGFLAGASVSIGGSPATNVNVTSSTSITATTPAHSAGTVNVVVTNTDGRSGTLTSGYTYTSPPAPTVTQISPNSGTTNGGTTVTITGTGFLAGASVGIGGSAATNINVSSSTSITATTPAHAAGRVNVVVTNTDGRSGTLTNGYTYTSPPPAPTVTQISPNSGTTNGGTTVTITGTGFFAGASVSIGGSPATNVNLSSSTSITASTPAHAAGTVNVVVTNSDGQSGTLTNGYTYASPNPAPTVTAILPNSGATGGGTSVTITGTGFLAGATVSLGGAPATNVIVLNSTSISATTPAHAVGTVNVVVTNTDGQSGTLINGYTYTSANPAPTVTAVSPNSGTTSGGTAVAITGTGFAAGATVNIGGSPASNVSVSSSTSITATTPAHALGSVNVVVTNTDGQSGTLTNGYTYTSPPTETVLLEDNFNDNSLNAAKWNANDVFSGYTDTTVPLVETAQRIEIGPLPQNTGGSHYRGMRSVNAYDFSGAYVYVELVQAASSATAGDAMFTIGNDVYNYYRIYVEGGSLICQRRAGGTKATLFTASYDPVSHRFLRIRHDAAAGRAVFETAPNNGGLPSSWVQRYSEVWNSSVSLASMIFELKGGTWQTEANAPGKVIFDNFKAAKP